MSDARVLTTALRGRWHGRYGLACCPAHHNTRTPALSLSNASDGRLLAHCHAGCSFRHILDALRGLELIDKGGSYTPPSPAELAALREAERRDAEKRCERALNCWKETLPIEGTPAERYLREFRGITAELPPSLRYHPEAWHGPTARRLPTMVALVEGLELPAIHRTYLAPDGAGKAQVEPNKMMLGGCAGGHVEIAKAQGPLVICEGIETGLALASGLLSRPATIWAALSTSGMTSLHLPEWVHRLTVATDGDAAGRQAGEALATRAKARGWQVSILPAPQGRDWADVLMPKRNAA